MAVPILPFIMEFARVRDLAVKEIGSAMTAESAAIPMIEPRPNNTMNKSPSAGSPSIDAVSTTSAADPASPCIKPTRKVRESHTPVLFLSLGGTRQVRVAA